MTHAELWYAKENHIPVLGHRGIAARYPENTLPSFEAAIRLGVDLIEFDINVTKDGELVVIHDNTIDRTSNHTGRTRDYSLAELKSFDFSYRFPAFSGVTIPTFKEVLELVISSASDTLLLNVEIKDIAHETVDQTIRMINEYGLNDRSVIACFDAEILRYTKVTYPKIRCQGFPGRLMQNFTEETYECMFGMGISISGENRSDKAIREDVAFAKSKGILAWLYTADTPKDVRRCVEYGCDNITGNDPEIALDTLSKMSLHTSCCS